MPTGKGKIRIVLMATAMALLAGCHEPQQNPPSAGESNTKESSDMRTVIPLVRRLEPTDTGPIELEFDVPVQPDDDAPPLFIGVRISGNDPSVTAEVARHLVEVDVSAQVHLFRLEPSGPVAVTLLRSEWVSRSEDRPVALPSDGLAPELMRWNADFSTMKAAGLLAEDTTYRELAFAAVPNLPTGRYRLVLNLIEHRQALTEANAEVLVAYTAKGK
jgi:hypothetical protein